MYMTIDQQVDCAYKAWVQVSDAKAAVMKKVRKIEKAIETAELGVEFELLYLEKRMVLVQYEALDGLYVERWVRYDELLKTRQIDDEQEAPQRFFAGEAQ